MASDAGRGEAVVQSAAVVAPAGAAHAGGDFQRVKTIGSTTVALVGDVAGSGTDAASYADRLCAELQEEHDFADPVALLEELNGRISACSGRRAGPSPAICRRTGWTPGSRWAARRPVFLWE